MSEKSGTNQLCWNELVTSDLKKSKEFYSKLLG
jgi:predicted enzyme related to lactoylglutathione lyase